MNAAAGSRHLLAVAAPIDPADRALVALVAAILTGRPAPADPALDLANVRRHLLAPLAHRAGIAALRGEYIAAALHAERRDQLLTEALTALAGVPVMRLKGIAYIEHLYDDPALRPMTDLDLMVPAAAFADARARLERLGYRDDRKRNQRSPVNHAVTLRRRESAIDLHRSMVQVGRMAIDLPAVWREAIPAGAGTVRPAPAHEYLIHLAHMARHEFTVALVSFVDADRLLARAGDVEALASAWHLSRAHAILARYLQALRAGAELHPRPFPSTAELLRLTPPARPLQVLRKLAIHDSVRDLPGLAWGAVRTRVGL